MTILTATISLSDATVLALAAAHIAQFAERIELRQRGTRVEDCRYYLDLWISIRTAINLGRSLGSEQVQELYDACTSGDFDMFLSAAEYRMVHLREPKARAS
jgi:hypothetical protein